MGFTLLSDYTESELWAGTVLQFSGKPHYEDLVEAMIVDSPESNYGIVFVISTGIKAGSIFLDPPIESKSQNGIAISKDWLLANWSKWISSECEVDSVKVKKHYAAG